MNKFLKRFFLVSLPIVCATILFEILLRNVPNDYTYKSDYLRYNSSEIEVLIMGSSHSFYGVIPSIIDENAFNASFVSQSIDIDYLILNKYKEKLTSLKVLIIPVDYFTFFRRLGESEESWRLKNYEIYFDLDVSNDISNSFEFTSKKVSISLERLRKYYLEDTTTITVSRLGEGKNLNAEGDLKISGKVAALRHTAEHLNYSYNKSIMEKFIDYAEKNNVKILFFTSPAYKSYVNNLSKDQLNMSNRLLKELLLDCSSCYYQNFLEDTDFDKSDFRDADHLNYQGATKLSMKLKNVLEAKVNIQ